MSAEPIPASRPSVPPPGYGHPQVVPAPTALTLAEPQAPAPQVVDVAIHPAFAPVAVAGPAVPQPPYAPQPAYAEQQAYPPQHHAAPQPQYAPQPATPHHDPYAHPAYGHPAPPYAHAAPAPHPAYAQAAPAPATQQHGGMVYLQGAPQPAPQPVYAPYQTTPTQNHGGMVYVQGDAVMQQVAPVPLAAPGAHVLPAAELDAVRGKLSKLRIYAGLVVAVFFVLVMVAIDVLHEPPAIAWGIFAIATGGLLRWAFFEHRALERKIKNHDTQAAGGHVRASKSHGSTIWGRRSAETVVGIVAFRITLLLLATDNTVAAADPNAGGSRVPIAIAVGAAAFFATKFALKMRADAA